MKNLKLAAAISALATLASVSANASIITNLDTTNGSENVLTVVNVNNNSSISVDLGFQRAAFGPGGSLEVITPVEGTYLLDSAVNSFISAAGGLASVTFSIIGGGLTGTGGSFIQTSANTDLELLPNTAAGKPLNTIRTTWNDALGNLITPLNAGDGSATSVNNTYPAVSSGSGSYVDIGGGYWGGATSGANANFFNLVAGNSIGYLFNVVFGTAASGRPAVSDTAKYATITSPAANQYQLNLLPQAAAVVPVPAAAWLFGSALGVMGVLRRRRHAQAG